MNHTAGNGNYLIRERRNAGAENNPGTPFVIIILKDVKLVHITVKSQNRPRNQVKEENADGIAESAAQHASNRCNAGNPPGFRRRRQNHRNQHNVRRNGKEGTLDKRNRKQKIHRVAARRQIKHIVIGRFDQRMKTIGKFTQQHPSSL